MFLFLSGLAFCYLVFLLSFWLQSIYYFYHQNFPKAAYFSQKTLSLNSWQGNWEPMAFLGTSSEMILSTISLQDKAKMIFAAILDNDKTLVQTEWPLFEQELGQFWDKLKPIQGYLQLPLIKKITSFTKQEQTLAQTQALLKQFTDNEEDLKVMIGLFPKIIGLNSDEMKNYVILLQNDKEIRPTGGFMGSYAVVSFKNGGLEDLMVQDIYVPDGALTGHVDPPEPIQQAFQQGKWRLANSNWDPDFVKASKVIEWFMVRGGVPEISGMIGVNFSVIEDLIRTLPPIYLPNLNTTLTADNFYEITQYEVEKDFFPGSTAKKDYLQQTTNAIFDQYQNLDSQQILISANMLYQHAFARDIQMVFKDLQVQDYIDNLNWSGSINWPNPLFSDYILINDANMGANKANCCVDKKVIQQVNQNPDGFVTTLTVSYQNNSVANRPDPPQHWGGNYRNYVRFYLPEQVSISSIMIGDEELNISQVTYENIFDKKLISVGFFVNVPFQESRQITLRYKMPPMQIPKYSLYIQKQSGVTYTHQVQFRNSQGLYETKRFVDQDQEVKF